MGAGMWDYLAAENAAMEERLPPHIHALRATIIAETDHCARLEALLAREQRALANLESLLQELELRARKDARRAAEDAKRVTVPEPPPLPAWAVALPGGDYLVKVDDLPGFRRGDDTPARPRWQALAQHLGIPDHWRLASRVERADGEIEYLRMTPLSKRS